MRRILLLAGILAASAAGVLPAQTSGRPLDGETQPELLPAGGVIEKAGIRIRAPRGWRRMKDVETGPSVIHLVGDGLGLPATDEQGGPLQIGMSVERFADPSAAELVAALTAEAANAPGRRLLGEIGREEVELDSGVRGTVLYLTFDRGGGRKSFYEQLVVADPQGGAWLVTGWIVGSAKSTLPARGSPLEARLASFIRSLELVRGAGE